MAEKNTPFVPAGVEMKEFTLRAVLLGMFLSILLGAANAYLGLKVGMTVAATFPAAVISMAVLRLFRGTILEENTCRTTAAVGEALAAGAIFTVPAFLIAKVGDSGQPIWKSLPYIETTVLMLLGGVLGVLFVTFLRRVMMDDQTLPFPESKACAEIVKAGQKGQTGAKYVFGALGFGALIQFFKNAQGLRLFKDSTAGFLSFQSSEVSFVHKNFTVETFKHEGGVYLQSPEASPAMMSVGYIIGPRLSSVVFSGGVLAWFVFVPLVLFLRSRGLVESFGFDETGRSAKLLPMSDTELVTWTHVATYVWQYYVRPFAVGSMIVAAVHTLWKMRISLSVGIKRAIRDIRRVSAKNRGIYSAKKTLLKDSNPDDNKNDENDAKSEEIDEESNEGKGESDSESESEGVGKKESEYEKESEGESEGEGEGKSEGKSEGVDKKESEDKKESKRQRNKEGEAENDEVSRLEKDFPLGLTMLLIFVLVIPISIVYYYFCKSVIGAITAAVVMTLAGFLFAAVAGYLVGTIGSSNNPISGLTLSTLVVAALLMLLIGVKGAAGIAAVLGVATVVCCSSAVAGDIMQDLKVGHILGGTPWKMELACILGVIAAALVMVFPLMWLHKTVGIGSKDLAAPQAGLMAMLAEGIISQKMAWPLVGMGAAFAVSLILIQAPSPMLIAIGMYLPFTSTAPIFLGGITRWLVDRSVQKRKLKESKKQQVENTGTLLASGLIAGEAVMGIVLAGVVIAGLKLPHLSQAAWPGVIFILVVAAILYFIPLNTAHED